MKILIVDDDPDHREAMSCFLEANGYQVLKASNGADGLKLAKLEKPDLILMDVVMDERTEGFFTVQEIRRSPELKNVPVFIVSAIYSKLTDFGIPPDSAWMAHDEFLAKPLDLTKLLEKIRERIGAPA